MYGGAVCCPVKYCGCNGVMSSQVMSRIRNHLGKKKKKCVSFCGLFQQDR